jgi:hypothetical protein
MSGSRYTFRRLVYYLCVVILFWGHEHVLRTWTCTPAPYQQPFRLESFQNVRISLHIQRTHLLFICCDFVLRTWKCTPAPYQQLFRSVNGGTPDENVSKKFGECYFVEEFYALKPCCCCFSTSRLNIATVLHSGQITMHNGCRNDTESSSFAVTVY